MTFARLEHDSRGRPWNRTLPWVTSRPLITTKSRE
jgi:hypothetical protein